MEEQIDEAVAYIAQSISGKPEIGIILGTGLGKLADAIENSLSIDFADIPNFPLATMEHHQGKLVYGEMRGRKVLVLQGRFHYYEGYNMQQVTLPVRVIHQLGVRQLLISNAAGGLDPSMELGDLMVINDHINLFSENPLVGKNIDAYGPRFPDMFEPYQQSLIDLAHTIGRQKGIKLSEGVYAGLSGPNLETKAEYRYLRIIGADAVGMSTIPEVLVGVHMGMDIFAVSVITDLCSPGRLGPVTLESVIAAANMAEPNLKILMEEMIGQLPIKR